MKAAFPPEIVLCAGLKSSASTWLYNAAIQLCEAKARKARGSRPRVLPFYAETVEQFPSGSERGGVLVVKTHIPSASLIFLARFVRGTVFLSVREPRDSVASLMQRFGHGFQPCVEEVAAGGARMVELARIARPFILRYEDRFFERPQTIARLATQLGLVFPKAAAEKIFQSLSAENVRKTIDALADRGTFGVRPDPDRFHSKTHWHPGHVGDGKTGKYAEILSRDMQRTVLEAMHEYCLAFGYEAAPRAESHGRKSAKTAAKRRGSGVRRANRLN
jgi:hypothetical protein